MMIYDDDGMVMYDDGPVRSGLVWSGVVRSGPVRWTAGLLTGLLDCWTDGLLDC